VCSQGVAGFEQNPQKWLQCRTTWM